MMDTSAPLTRGVVEAALERMDRRGHVNREVVRDLWRRRALTQELLDYLERAPYGMTWGQWKERMGIK